MCWSTARIIADYLVVPKYVFDVVHPSSAVCRISLNRLQLTPPPCPVAWIFALNSSHFVEFLLAFPPASLLRISERFLMPWACHLFSLPLQIEQWLFSVDFHDNNLLFPNQPYVFYTHSPHTLSYFFTFLVLQGLVFRTLVIIIVQFSVRFEPFRGAI